MSIIDTTQDITVTDDLTSSDIAAEDIAQHVTVIEEGIAIADAAAEQVATEELAGARVVQIDPHALIVEENIRQEVNLPRSFVASIRQHGVIVPILAHPDVDGNIVVRDGQRRVLAARDAGTPTVPAYVVDADDEKRVRIIQQIITNDHRDALTDADRATAWRQLALDGMSVTAIAKQTGAKRETVKTGLAVAGHDIAKTAVAEHDITLDQALVLIEFEDDPDALTTLRDVARKNPESFDHYAQRLLDDKATKEEIATLRADYEAQGYTVVEWPGWDDTTTLFLRDLQTADGEQLTEENYAGKPGHAVAIGERWGSVSVGHVVVDWKAHGLRRISSTGTTLGGKMTEEEKAARRELIANNKAWVSAEKVRREWLTAMLNRKRLPKDALPFAIITLASEDFEVGKAVTDHHRLANELLGYEYSYGHQPLATHVQDAPTKAPQIALALAVGALEAATDKNTWRNPDATAIRYFQQLADWGYTLSDVENIVLGITPEAAADAETQETSGDDTGQNDASEGGAETPEPEDAPVKAGDTGDTPDEAGRADTTEADATDDDEGIAEAAAA